MSQFSFYIELNYDDSSRLLCATLTPKFDSTPLTEKRLSALLRASDYRNFYLYESSITELIAQAEALTEKGQKLYQEYLNRLQKISLKETEPEQTDTVEEDLQTADIEAETLPTDASESDSLESDTLKSDTIKSNNSSDLTTEPDVETETDAETATPDQAPEASPETSISPEKIFAMLGEQQVSFQIAECRDAELRIDISEDALEAHLSITRPYGGQHATEKSINAALKKQGIEFGVDKAALKQALESEHCADILIASGSQATKGKDSKFEALVSEQISSAPKIEASGKVNYHEINEFVIVEPGAQLMRRSLPGKGKPGTDVFGKVIPAIPGDVLPFSGDTVGSKLSEQDPNLLIASAKGHPIIKARGVSVENILILRNVGLSTGNVDFDGSVCVEGDVADGVKIKASGDVTVKGVVGKATIIAGGNIVILQGLLGGSKALQDNDEEPYGAFLTSKNSVYVHFVTRAKIRAAKKIVIAEYASHSDLNAKEQILIGQEGGKGNLFGGQARAFKLVAAKVIGCNGGTPTQIQVGGEGDNIPKLRRITQEKRQNSEHTYDVNEALHKIKLLAKSVGMTPQMKEKAEQLNNKLENLQRQLRELSKQEETIKQILIKSKKSKVIANYQIYNNTTVTILGASKKITEETKGGTFKFEARKVVLEK